MGKTLKIRNAGEIALCGIKVFGHQEVPSTVAHTRGRGVTIEVDS